MSIRRRVACLSAGILPLPLLAATAPAAPAVTVIELFTSQGCSDCPPADALVGELGRLPRVLSLTYHVTYWDALGWHDGFGTPVADARQEYYARQMHLSTVFTPQAVVDGRINLIGSDREGLLKSLRISHATIPIGLGISNDEVHVSLSVQAMAVPLNVILVGYLPQAETAIGAGENVGRKLKEFDIVRAYRMLGVWNGPEGHFSVPVSSLPADASRVAVLLQQPDGLVAGAATISVR